MRRQPLVETASAFPLGGEYRSKQKQGGCQQAEDREPRLAPKPLDRPPVDPTQAAVFGRPRGVDGAFDKLYTPNGRGPDKIIVKPPAPESLAEAFGRPPGAEDVQLQRPADGNGNGSGKPGEAPLWSKTADPWRDPGAPAVLGGPALEAEDAAKDDDERPRGA